MLLSDIFALKGEGGGGSVVIVSATPPAIPDVGTQWLDSGDSTLSIWDGTAWVVTGRDSSIIPSAVILTLEDGTIITLEDGTILTL